jgi:hypothetical protein
VTFITVLQPVLKYHALWLISSPVNIWEPHVSGIKKLLMGFGIGAVIGLWFGINLGKGQSLYSNPFHEVSIKHRLIESGGDMLEKSGKALKSSLGK